jgi:hypothetical protein
MMHKVGLTFIVVACWWGSAVVAQPVRSPESVLARAGDLFVTEREFLQRFELLPALQRSRKSRLEESKMELLYSLIAEKLLAQEARDKGVERDSAFLSSFDEVRKLLARDQLYRNEISSKVSVSQKEVSTGIAEAQREILISFIFFEKKEDAAFVRRQIKTERDFDRMRLDTSLHAVRDTATVIWNDAEKAIERTAYRLKKGEISGVVKAGSGFYILKIQGTRSSPFYSSLQPSVLQERVSLMLRQRKEEARLNEFVSEALRDKVGYSRPVPFKRLGLALEKELSKASLTGKVALSSAMVADIRSACRDALNDTLAVAGARVWSLGEVLEQLSSRGFFVDSASVKSLPALLNGQVRTWVQQELLAQEALRRGLDQYPEVRVQLDMWYQSYLAQWMKMTISRRVSVSEAEALSFLKQSDTAFAIPQVKIQELKTSTLDQMQQALNELDKGKGMDEVIAGWCSDPELRQRKGIVGPFPVHERGPVGELAWQMTPGERYGPLKDTTGYIYFELLWKEDKGAPGDTSFAARLSTAKKALTHMKEKRLLTLFLAQTGGERGFDVYQDRLMKLQVSSTPMMTFRVVGFGGRMFAVPFVDPQIEWLGVAPPSEKIVF